MFSPPIKRPNLPAKPAQQPQRKLAIGPATGRLEQEAERAADTIACQRRVADFSTVGVSLRRSALQTADSSTPVPPRVHQVLSQHGRPLERPLRAEMESRFDRDFSAVRIHDGAEAAESAREVGARAYTVGRDIVFGRGESATSSPAGLRLIAHELAHVVQQGGDRGGSAEVVQRDLAIEPSQANAQPPTRAQWQKQPAITFNRILFKDADEIGALRDVLGIARKPAVVDEDFVDAVARYQSSFGINADGMISPITAEKLATEIAAEADSLKEPPGTALRRVARRLHLRSLTSRFGGTVAHQGFFGDDANPEGAVTVRTGDQIAGTTGQNMISLEHTGEKSDDVHWLQFINLRMSATPPTHKDPVFQPGPVGASGGSMTWSDAATTHWHVDELAKPDGSRGSSPFYDVSGGITMRTPGLGVAMLDMVSKWMVTAQAFVAPGALAAGAPTVTVRFDFASYTVRANVANYRVDWRATSVFTMTPTPTEAPLAYSQVQGAAVTKLATEHSAALQAEFPGSAIR